MILVLLALLGPQDDLVGKRDAKLAESWLGKADWVTDYDRAVTRSRESGKLIFGYFTRSTPF